MIHDASIKCPEDAEEDLAVWYASITVSHGSDVGKSRRDIASSK